MDILKKYNITANKKLGQNFLINDDVIENIVKAANIKKDDLIIEIGPGLGTLTKKLLEEAGKVICIELDKKMLVVLNDRFKFYDNFKLINEDILQVNLKMLIEQEKQENLKNVKIVANLPYYITTPIIMKLLEDRLDIESITVMVQKEVAQRMAANPGSKTYGALSVAVQYYTIPKIALYVPPRSFMPPPEVDSVVVNCKVRPQPAVDLIDEKMFFRVVKAAFGQRRKTLNNALKSMGVDKNTIADILTRAGIEPSRRGETLTMEEFAAISNILSQTTMEK